MADQNEKSSPTGDDNASDNSGGGAQGGVGGIFDVPAGKKRAKKSSDDPDEAASASDTAAASAAENADQDDGAQDTLSKKQRLKQKLADDTSDADADDTSTADTSGGQPAPASSSVGGVFQPDGPSGGSDDSDLGGDYLGQDDLDGHGDGGGGTNTSTIIMGGVIVVLVVALGFVVMKFTDIGGDLGALFRGDLRERRQAAARQKEEAWDQKQRAKLEKYGVLNVAGSPLYALIQLDGQTQYGQTSSGAWRELRLTSSGATFQNLKVKRKHTIDVDAPGFKPDTIELTEGMWRGGQGPYSYSKRASVNLIPDSGQHQLEFEQRMDTSDTEGEYLGKVTINSMPAGAKIIFDNHPLLDEDGQDMVTPVTFESYYVKDEDSDRLEKKEINVDTPPDRGHKIQLQIPKDKGDFPKYIAALQRRMWTCKWTDGKAPAAPPSGKTFRDLCQYTYTLETDFNGLKSYIERREAEKKRIKEKNAKLQAKKAEQAKKANKAQ